MQGTELTRLVEGTPVPFGGNRVAVVTAELAAAFRPGDRLVVVQTTGDLLHIPAGQQHLVDGAVDRALDAVARLRDVADEAISSFFAGFAARLADDGIFSAIAAANEADVAAARARGRSTTRLALTASMRSGMIAGLRSWIDQPAGRDVVVRSVDHDGWRVEARRAPLGVVGFVFEGRPNVFADAVGVVRSGNTVVFRIGSDALGTARAIVEHAMRPALADAGLPGGTIELVDSAEHSAGWALFSHRRIGLAVARGSGAAVAQLGAVARQAGTPVSLHGTGGAWLVAGESADLHRFGRTARWSLDRKVCNTMNVCCILRSRAAEAVPVLLASLREAAAARRTGARLHVVSGSEHHVATECFTERSIVRRADGDHDEPFADLVGTDVLGHEWEWEDSPELTLLVVDSIGEAVEQFNRWSPRLAASLIAEDPAEQQQFWNRVEAPFVGDGFTRWVDGQFALGTPELGLSNWEGGRLLGRAGVLSGDGIYTIRFRARQDDVELHR